MIPLAQVFALEFTSPLWVVVLAPLVLGERLTAMRALAAVLGFVGVLIIAQPWVGNLGPGVIAAAAAAIGFAGSAVFTRRLTRTESVTCILFWLTTLQAVFGLVCAGWDGDITLPSTATAPWLVLIGCAGLLAHFCLTRALSLAPATVVIPIDFTRLPLIALIGYLVYGEAVGAEVYLGASIIIAANLLNLRSETRR
jgi:drug/metabolite transporter (DMT)-like permease